MTYEILLYPRRPDQAWAEVLEADEADTSDEALQDETALADGVATFGRIEARLREQVTGPVETWVAEETGGDVFGEFSASDSGLQVELFHGSAAVSFPREERDGLDALHEDVRQAVRIVVEETGYQAYDPQTEDGFDGSFGTAQASAAAPEESAPVRADPRQEPAFLRRRGRLYLLLGALLTGYGLWRLLGDGGTGWITIAVLVIGVIDLLGGLMMLSLARTAAENRLAEDDRRP